MVYLKEAHPSDGWQVGKNKKDKVVFKDPKTLEERGKIAAICKTKLKLSIPFVVDNMKNSTNDVYAGWPDRIYIVGKDGTIKYKGKPGPRGFSVSEMETKLAEILKTK